MDIDRNTIDLATQSNYRDVVSTHLHFDWIVNFKNKQLTGSVTLSMRVLKDGVNVVELDISKLQIVRATIASAKVNHSFPTSSYKLLGTKLSIQIPEKFQSKGSEFALKIDYVAGSSASAMQWLEASNTKGGKYPYLFTQCQAIHARSMFPCQDTPSVKTSYSAVVSAPDWCTVLMSALNDSKVIPAKQQGKAGVTGWLQPVPTPAYLVALAAGNLSSRDISARVRIWSEPEVVEAAASDFSETELFLQAAESLTCPYQWTRYDVLCLPPSFPYGGMENPCLTFATPTLLTGDKSLADVIAHEIAHSWTGNLVTNATWEHFWLNEGWTVWLERKITAKVKKNNDFFKLSALAGWKHVKDDIDKFGHDHIYTRLVREPSDDDPDDSFSSVPYEKGFNLLYYLEGIIGTEKFEAFAKNYINKYARQTVTSGDFKDHFLSFVASNCDASTIANVNKTVNWDVLFHAPGMPSYTTPDFSSSLDKVVHNLSNRWIASQDCSSIIVTKEGASRGTGNINSDIFSSNDMKNWISAQKCIFLDDLQLHVDNSRTPFPLRKLELLNETYDFNACMNAEIRSRWQLLCLKTPGCDWIVPHVVSFITSQGRMKFVRPIYRALNANTSIRGNDIAKSTFTTNASMYHPIARKMIAQDLSVDLSVAPITASTTSSSSTPSAASSSSSSSSMNSSSINTSWWSRFCGTSCDVSCHTKSPICWFSLSIVIGVGAAAAWYYMRNKKLLK